MGFSSWTCAKTHLPILHFRQGHFDKSAIVAIFPDGSSIRGQYDGYGRILQECDSISLDPDADDQYRIVLEAFYDPITDTFESLGPNHPDPGQGHFHNLALLNEWYAAGGFASHQDFLHATSAT